MRPARFRRAATRGRADAALRPDGRNGGDASREVAQVRPHERLGTAQVVLVGMALENARQ
jgi:hypothetical protein